MDAHLQFTFPGKRLHLGVCGSIAAYKALDLVRRFKDASIDVGATLTASASEFVTPLSFAALGASPVHTDMFPAGSSTEDRDVFAHLMPGSSAHCLCIAPCSADMLAKLANGAADTMLACQALAFDGPVVVAPAMNPRMWANPATQANWQTLARRGLRLVPPVSGRVACMDQGEGRFADWRSVFSAVASALAPQDLEGTTVMITLGPTREGWDGVRYWTNPSTGLMGASLAMAAHLRGAKVLAVCGPGTEPGAPWLPDGILRTNVTTAREMYQAASDLWPSADMGIFTAAVADFSPQPLGARKFKKNEAPEGFSLTFTPNPDILANLAQTKRPDQRVVGFAAETDNLEEQVRAKLDRKNADLVVGNLVGQPGSGFGGSTNTAFIADRSGAAEYLDEMPKPQLAWRILDWLLRL